MQFQYGRGAFGFVTFSCALALGIGSAAAQQENAAARALLEEAAEAMGGLERLQGLENMVLTGFGQRVYQQGGGFVTGDPDAPAKWQALADAQRSFDLQNERALNQERRSFMFPFAAEFGMNWARANTLQTGAEALDHPLPALLESLDPETELGQVTTEDGVSVVQFTTEDGTPMWMGINSETHLPEWTRWISANPNLGEVTHTAHFTGYLPFDGVHLPIGLMNEMDWRDQTTLMFQVDSYRIDVAAEDMPPFPEPAGPGAGGGAGAPQVDVTRMAEGVWDLRVPGAFGGAGGAVIEFDDHLVMFEAYGSEAQALARIDAANELVPGKEVEAVIVSHHHFDHTGGLRAAVSRGLTVIAQRGNEQIIREMVTRPAPNFPDALAMDPQRLDFVPVDEHLVLEDDTRRLDIYHVVDHFHMADAVFAYLPEERILMEGDLSDVNWQWHWWGSALLANVEHYGLDPQTDIPVHGEVTSFDAAVERVQEQVEAAQAYCEESGAVGLYVLGCPVQHTSTGQVPLSALSE